MPYNRPTLTALRAQVASDIATDLPGIDTLLRYANLRVTGDVQAGLASGLHDHIDYAHRQSVPFTARDEALAGWGALKSTYIKAATKASFTVAFIATGNEPIPAATELTRSDGAVFITGEEASPDNGQVVVTATADQAGANGNSPVGTVLYLSIGISGISPQGSVMELLSEGADIETQDEFLSRVIAAYQATAAGGLSGDYVNWALSVSGVTRAWCVPRGYGVGTVVVLFMMDDVRAAYGGFPQGTDGLCAADPRDVSATGDQLIVANALEADQPADPRVYLKAPGQNAVSFTIAGIASSSVSVREAIAQAITTALTAYGLPGGTTPFDKINAAIASVSGASGAVITSMACTRGSISPGPIGNIISDALALPVLGAVNYI